MRAGDGSGGRSGSSDRGPSTTGSSTVSSAKIRSGAQAVGNDAAIFRQFVHYRAVEGDVLLRQIRPALRGRSIPVPIP
jgi:hypothetical protein